MSTFEITSGIKRHPLSALFPSMPEAELVELSEDIKRTGQREPVMVYERQILDGWHRLQACQIAGVPCKAREFPADADAVAYVKSKNLHRRSMDASQRAIAVVMLSEWLARGSNQHKAVGKKATTPMANVDSNPVATHKEMAKEAGVSVETIKQAKAAVQNGHADAVKEGKISVKQAAKKNIPSVDGIKSSEKPKPPTALEKLQTENSDLKDQLNSIHEKQVELAAELEAAFAAAMGQDEQLQKFRELTTRTMTLETLLDQEKEKSRSFLKENKWLRSELKKLGWGE